MRSVVVDSSVALKWFLADEPGRDQALVVRDALVHAEVEALAPSQLSLELCSGLIRAARRGRLAAAEIPDALAAFWRLEIVRVGADSVLGRAARLALDLGLSVHDASFLASAIAANAKLITADRLLYEKAMVAGYDAVWLEDLPPGFFAKLART
jgi:predicted nucleic acid-binding protein